MYASIYCNNSSVNKSYCIQQTGYSLAALLIYCAFTCHLLQLFMRCRNIRDLQDNRNMHSVLKKPVINSECNPVFLSAVHIRSILPKCIVTLSAFFLLIALFELFTNIVCMASAIKKNGGKKVLVLF